MEKIKNYHSIELLHFIDYVDCAFRSKNLAYTQNNIYHFLKNNVIYNKTLNILEEKFCSNDFVKLNIITNNLFYGHDSAINFAQDKIFVNSKHKIKLFYEMLDFINFLIIDLKYASSRINTINFDFLKYCSTLTLCKLKNRSFKNISAHRLSKNFFDYLNLLPIYGITAKNFTKILRKIFRCKIKVVENQKAYVKLKKPQHTILGEPNILGINSITEQKYQLINNRVIINIGPIKSNKLKSYMHKQFIKFVKLFASAFYIYDIVYNIKNDVHTILGCDTANTNDFLY